MASRAALRRKGKDESCTFYVWFRHSVLGRPVERSLRTADEKHARTLAECLNLILADPAWHHRVRPATPTGIVDVFYEPIKDQLAGVRFAALKRGLAVPRLSCGSTLSCTALRLVARFCGVGGMVGDTGLEPVTPSLSSTFVRLGESVTS